MGSEDLHELDGVYDLFPTDGDPHDQPDVQKELSPNDLVLTSRPLEYDDSKKGDKIGGGDKVLHPGDTAYESDGHERAKTWYANAPSGSVLLVDQTRVPNTGGHHHGGATKDTLAVGTMSASRIVLSGRWPQNFPITHVTPMVSGQVHQTFEFVGHPYINVFQDTRIKGLVQIVSSASLKLKAPTSEHPSSYWATPTFRTKLQKLADQYHAKTGDGITVTEGCLEWGGRFDLKLDWRPPHREHFYGNTADIRSWDIKDQSQFKAAAAAAGIQVLVEPDHFHVRG